MTRSKREPAELRRLFIREHRRLAARVKRFVQSNSAFYRALEHIYKFFPNSEIAAILTDYAREHQNVRFIQIGAGDGVAGDPIHGLIRKYRWSGILVEPVPFLFEQLKSSYAGCSGLQFEKLAVSNEDGRRDFWTPCQTADEIPRWYQLLGSFFPEVIAWHGTRIPNVEKYFVKESVPCVALSTLLRRHDLQPDLIHIDTEGFDYQIIRQIDFDTWKPAIILYEHSHLQDGDKAACAELLRKNGYSLVEEGTDTLAFRPG